MELSVEGMMCRGCEERIENALKNMGLHAVKADRTAKTVSWTGEADLAEVKETIEDLGFDVNA